VHLLLARDLARRCRRGEQSLASAHVGATGSSRPSAAKSALPNQAQVASPKSLAIGMGRDASYARFGARRGIG
jgi:hypothetical protein